MGSTAGQVDHPLTRASEDYLEAIFRLSRAGDGQDPSVRSVDVAELLGVSKASVNKALTLLRDRGMVEQSPYGRVTLTDEGTSYASLVWRAHRVLRAFLEGALGVEPQSADEQACLMEHVLSEDTMRRLVDYLERQGIEIPK